MDETEAQQVDYKGHVLTESIQRINTDQGPVTRTVWRVTDSRGQIVARAKTLNAAKQNVDDLLGR